MSDEEETLGQFPTLCIHNEPIPQEGVQGCQKCEAMGRSSRYDLGVTATELQEILDNANSEAVVA